jgi:arylformamidase
MTLVRQFGPSTPRARWSELSQTERDAAYDNNSAVKNSAALIAERNEASERLRHSLKSHIDLPYLERAKTKIDLSGRQA